MAFTLDQLNYAARQAYTSMQNDTWLQEPIKANFYKSLEELVDYISGKSTVAPTITPTHPRDAYCYMPLLKLVDIRNLDEQDQKLIKVFAGSKNAPMFMSPILQQIADQILAEKDEDGLVKAMVTLRQFGLTDEAVLFSLAGVGSGATSTSYYIFFYDRPKLLVHAAGKYIASLFPEYKNKIVDAFITKHASADWSGRLVEYLAQHTTYDLSDFLYYSSYGTTYLCLDNAIYIATYNPELHQKALWIAYDNGNTYVTKPAVKYFILRAMADKLPEAYRTKQLDAARTYLENHITEGKGYWGYHEASFWMRDQSGRNIQKIVSPTAMEDLFQYEPENAAQIASDYLRQLNIAFISPEVLQVIDKHLGEKAVDVLALGLETEKGNGTTLKVLLELLGKYDYSRHVDKVWNITKDKSKSIRLIAATELAKLGEAALPKCQELLGAKSADVRQTVAVILSRIKTPEAEKILLDTVNSEKNDDTRDVMIEALGERRYQHMNEQQITDMIVAAQKRGKLDAPLADWLDEKTLPALTFTASLSVNNLLATRFLIYRMSRAKEIRSDVEARPLLALIDKASSGAFAKKLFSQFIDNGGDAKQKYCLTLAGFLGDDSLVDVIRPQINKWVESNRGKMAEYGVVALALIGTNKALRAVEFFSRKYKTKYSNIGTAALNALQVAAEELGMDMNELADSIIPDFGFENMYKTFKVGEDEFRTFINKDFKLAFLNEDNKLLKSAPKNTPKPLLDEFKEIGKEVRDVVRSQSSRMELYLVIQRKWKPEKWQSFFVNNPIMFVYATHLLWGTFDASGKLSHTFYCAEDTSLLNLQDEEITIAEDSMVGMVHPLDLSEEERAAWIQKFYEAGIEPLFPQLLRPSVLLSDTDKDLTEVEEFADKKGNAVQIKGAFKRFGWTAWELGDHGDIYSFSKSFDELGVQAFIETGGGLFMGYTEDGWMAEFGKCYFRKMAGNIYQSPNLPLGEVPPIVYSEVLSELRQIVPEKAE
ncbi:DUF4132 domain-containing protein [Cytophagaceae bacterium DM2B3-1]|uniref:DUF4132 domain-containing protein n=1 Tax=Xanthocytophaga flava TaxID=3048013 RepID=A0ABT7CLY3_9BACT|nr:DUF4132 domain-containing protein [Xanthocytophaga flavus]MDJ1494760.1 DUF4132 domain-containing protein [Xanthocytophaga flavus]